MDLGSLVLPSPQHSQGALELCKAQPLGPGGMEVRAMQPAFSLWLCWDPRNLHVIWHEPIMPEAARLKMPQHSRGVEARNVVCKSQQGH